MQWLYEFGVAIWDWFGDEDHQNRVTAIAAALGVIITIASTILGAVWYVARRILRRPKPTEQMPQAALPKGDVLFIEQHLAILQRREDQLEDRLAEAHQGEKDLLQRQIAELQSQIANPEKSLAEARKRIADLEILLDRESNHIGGDRIKAAKEALEQGDYSLADDIFAEIEARNELAVQETARAAYGRGEVAEAEVRWQDAATHYATAARLDPGFDNLFKARQFAWRAGNLAAAHRYGEDLVEFARNESTQEQIATALNEHALTIGAQGQYAEAEGLYREALEVYRATIGEQHPHYAIGLSNLALVVQAQGRHAEAEKLYREALEIDRATIGEGHPDYAIRLNNLALVVQAQRRYEESERLSREARDITRKTIGEGHPDYANRLNNLAGVVQAQGRVDEAESLYREALEIDRLALGEGHPDYAIDLLNLGSLLGQTGRVAEGRGMLEQALAIFEAALPADHPYIAEAQRRLAALPDE